MAITFVSMSEFNLLKCSHFMRSFELLENRKKTYTYLYIYCVYNQLQNKKNHRCQCKQMHVNYSGSQRHCVSHLTAVL